MITDFRLQTFLLATCETGGWEIREEVAAAEEGLLELGGGKEGGDRGWFRERKDRDAGRREMVPSSRPARDSLTKGVQASTKKNKRERAIPGASSRGSSYHPEPERVS